MKNLIVITSVVTITSSSIHEKYINSVRSEVSKFHCSNFTFAVAFPIEAQATFAQYVSSHQWRILPPIVSIPVLSFYKNSTVSMPFPEQSREAFPYEMTQHLQNVRVMIC